MRHQYRISAAVAKADGCLESCVKLGTKAHAVAMSTLFKRLLLTAVSVLLLFVVGFGIWFWLAFVRAPGLHIEKALLTPDHQVVKNELHSLWLNYGGNHLGSETGVKFTDLKTPTLSALEPHWASVSAGQVRFELGGAECHFGYELIENVSAISPKETSFRMFFPSKEVLPGLWYYAELGLPK